MVDYFQLINPTKSYNVYRNSTIHSLGMKYDHYTSNTLIKGALSIIMMKIFGLPKQFHSLQNY
jgi:hypothetical protein